MPLIITCKGCGYEVLRTNMDLFDFSFELERIKTCPKCGRQLGSLPVNWEDVSITVAEVKER